MKELSIEQKAKAYDEAIERARYWEKNPTVWSSDDICQKLFPELKESEDERMKRIISDILLIDSDEIREILDSNNILMQDIEAWLEKQGEQKSIEWVGELEEKLSNATPEQLAEWKEKYFKEEYAEWSEEDEMQLDAAIHLVSNTGHIETANWLISLKDRVQPQKEWSDEDERLREYCINAINGIHYYSPENKQELVGWLKYLRPHHTWKPSEEMLEALYRAIPENVMEISEDEMLLDKLYQGLKYGRVLSNK